MQDLFGQVYLFNRQVLGLPVPAEPTRLSWERKAWALRALEEELMEFRDSTDIVEEADALGDLIYFAVGRFMEMGIDPVPIMDEIQRANMDKVKGSLSKRPNSLGFDAIKPEGWQAPQHKLKSCFHTVPKVAVIGHAGHGKDTFSEVFSSIFGLGFASSSMFVAERIVYPLMQDQYPDAKACYEDRANHRAFWHESVKKYIGEDKARIGRELLQTNDVYCGIRDAGELAAVKAEGLVQAVIWVDASRRLPPEPESSCTVTPDMADFVVYNHDELPEDEAKSRLHEQAVDAFISLDWRM